jgi:hypothetical protein
MIARYIYPEDLKCTEYCSEWAEFCSGFGYQTPPSCILVCEIKVNN